MCGRVAAPSSEIIVTKTGFTYNGEHFDRNISAAPTDGVPLVASGYDSKTSQLNPNELQRFRWDLIPWYTKPDPKTGKPLTKKKMFNATSEKLEDPASVWSKIFGKFHCVIITSGFYEWQRLNNKGEPDPNGKILKPYYITAKEGDFTYIAGLWGKWIPKEGPTAGEITYSCTAITHPANELMAEIHNKAGTGKRMPAFIRKEDIPIWLDNGLSKEERKKVIAPVPSDFIRAVPIQKVGDIEEYETVQFW